MKNLQMEYTAPTIEMEVVAVEQGFAASTTATFEDYVWENSEELS